jgi:hypothetical protein
MKHTTQTWNALTISHSNNNSISTSLRESDNLTQVKLPLKKSDREIALTRIISLPNTV